MDLDFDSSYILYGLGAILGIAAIIHFSSELILSLSPTVKSVLLFLLFGLLLLLGNRTEIKPLDIALYTLSAASYLVFLTYTIGKFDYTANQTFILLGLSSVLFLGLGYLVREKDFRVSMEQAKNWSIGILVLGLALVAFDAAGAQTTYLLEPEQQVTVTQEPGQQVQVGEVTATNRFLFSRQLELPNYRGCLYLPDSAAREQVDVSIHYDYRSTDSRNLIGGSEQRQYPLQLGHTRVLEDQNISSMENIPVEQMESCPEESDVGLVIVPGDRSSRSLEPAPARID